MLDGIKKYVAGIAGAVMIGAGVVLGGTAIDEYICTNDVYYPKGTAIVVKNDQITDIYSTEDDLWVLEDSLFHVINGQNIELHKYDTDILNLKFFEGSIRTSGKVIELPQTHEGVLNFGPFSKGRANGLSYERNDQEILYDISWETSIDDPDEVMIRYGPSDYHSTLQEINDHIASNMSNYLKSALDKISDEEYNLILTKYQDPDFFIHDDYDLSSSIQEIVNSVRTTLRSVISRDIYETYGTITYIDSLAMDFNLIDKHNSGLAEGESVAYLTGEDYITELTDVAGWVVPNIIFGIVLSLGGLTVAGVGLRKKPKRKNKEKKLFTDGEIIDHAKQQWEQDADLTDPALYAQEQLKALENS